MKEFSLIANSGLQFITTEVDFNPSESVVVNDTPVTLYFAEYPSGQPNINRFEIAYKFQGSNVGMSELRALHCIKQQMDVFGECVDALDPAGQPIVDRTKINLNNMWEIPSNQCYSEYNAEGSFQLYDGNGNAQTPLQKVLGKWLPVPMFYLDDNKASRNCYPTSWCRVRIDEVSKEKNSSHFRLTWAFDTTLSDNQYDQSLPYFPSNTPYLDMGICNRIAQYVSFLDENSWVSDYLGALIFGNNVLPQYHAGDFIQRCRHLGFYISLFTQLRLIDGACPVIKLYNCTKEPINVDLVLDIGNSRTCGVLYEDNDLTSGTLLALRDISQPWKLHRGSFDMRLAFHRASFGEGNMGLNNVFEYRSFLRIGEEAYRLISTEQLATGLSSRLTHHSSPKRYLWDSAPYKGKWEFLLTDEEPSSPHRDAVYVKRLSEQFKVDGTFRTDDDILGDLLEEGTSFSRRSLMTMVMIEIIQQALMQINSYDYLNPVTGHGKIDRKRILNNIILTCPTAMSQKEQIILRKCAEDAFIAINRSHSPEVLYENYKPEQWKGMINIVPSEADLSITDEDMRSRKAEWGFDEATCCQMVYLYSEIIDKYKGNSKEIIEVKGHVRPEHKAEGYDRKSLTIGSVDMGAGTTDLMICTYKYSQTGDQCTLTPIPLFWDSFNNAGDDILHEIVSRVVLKEQDAHINLRPGYGSILNAITCNLAGDRISILPDSEKEYLHSVAMGKLIGFFGENAPSMSALDRIMRNDFNVQVSVPIAQKMMDMMKNMDTARDLTFNEIFSSSRPSASLLTYFENRFGFKLEDLKWSYSPEIITECIRCRTEPLLKQLSIILRTYNCDVVLLAGRPMSLEALTDMFVKFFPVSPDRIIRLLPKNDKFLSSEKKWNCYKVGRWFPTSDERGYFKDLKPVVAVGAMVAYKAEHGMLPKFQLNMSEMRKNMVSTANYIGAFNASLSLIYKEDVYLTPETSTARFTVSIASLPFFLGCKQINTNHYQARPMFVLQLKPGVDTSEYDMSEIRVTISRRFTLNKEDIILQSAIDSTGQDVTDMLEIKIQSLVTRSHYEEQNEFWLDNGAFNLN